MNASGFAAARGLRGVLVVLRDRDQQDWNVASLECLTNDRGSSLLKVPCPRERDQVRIALRGGVQDVLAGIPTRTLSPRAFRARAVTGDELAPPGFKLALRPYSDAQEDCAFPGRVKGRQYTQ